MSKIALVTGAYRGLGLGTVEELAKLGYKVILTARHSDVGESKAADLRRQGLDVVFLPLDMSSDESINTLAQSIKKDYGHLDVLVNNAAILLDKQGPTNKKRLMDTLDTNVVGVYQLSEALLPLLKASSEGRIVNVSSGMGQLSEMAADYPSYRISKAALNAVTKVFAAKTHGTPILVNSVCPGWVKTDMGGEMAPRSLEEGVKSIVWAVKLPANGPTGGFFRDGQPLAW